MRRNRAQPGVLVRIISGQSLPKPITLEDHFDPKRFGIISEVKRNNREVTGYKVRVVLNIEGDGSNTRPMGEELTLQRTDFATSALFTSGFAAHYHAPRKKRRKKRKKSSASSSFIPAQTQSRVEAESETING